MIEVGDQTPVAESGAEVRTLKRHWKQELGNVTAVNIDIGGGQVRAVFPSGVVELGNFNVTKETLDSIPGDERQ